MAARTGEELAERFVDACHDADCSYALTGLAAAWLLAPFASYRLVAAYISNVLSNEVLASLKWNEESRGANLWLIRPNDEGVFHGSETVRGLVCVSPVQAYLDLHAMPERSEEAAEQLRKERLRWR